MILPISLREQFVREASEFFPRECCGLIEGKRDGGAIEALALHPTRNLARDNDRFEIDPGEHIRLLKTLRGTDREIVGCYHSHPNGLARPSPRDLDAAVEENFVWLIAAIDTGGDVALAAHLFADGAFRQMQITYVGLSLPSKTRSQSIAKAGLQR